MPRLKDLYREQVVQALQKELGYDNVMQVPRLEKIVVNVGMGEALQNARALDAAVQDITTITGQRPIVTELAAYRELAVLALARQRDFRGISADSFDGRGNYSLGLREQLVFPEIDYDSIDKIRGMEVTIVTTAQTDKEGYLLLRHLGMPFAGR